MLARPFFMCPTTLLVLCGSMLFAAALYTDQERLDNTNMMLSKPGWPKYLSEVQLKMDGHVYNINDVWEIKAKQEILVYVVDVLYGLLACSYAVTLKQLMVYGNSIALFFDPEASDEEKSTFTSSFMETIESSYLLIARMHKSLYHVELLAPDIKKNEHFLSRLLNFLMLFIVNMRSVESEKDCSRVVSTLSDNIVLLNEFVESYCVAPPKFYVTEIAETSQEQMEGELKEIIRNNIFNVLPSLGIPNL